MKLCILRFQVLACGLGMSFLTQCATPTRGSSKSEGALYRAFRDEPEYPKHSKIYRDDKLLSRAASEKKVVIDVSDQRALLYLDGKVGIDAPCCTGKAGKRTPFGTFPIGEKIADKRSTIFGTLYRNGKKVYSGDRRRYAGGYDSYVGASLPHWMRLTNDGIGIHGSKYVHRSPGSNGCVRMPLEAVAAIFEAVDVGTPVEVVD